MIYANTNLRANSNTCWLDAPGVVCALGAGLSEIRTRLQKGDVSGLVSHSDWVQGRSITLGAVTTPLPKWPTALPSLLDCRNNRLLLAAAQQIELHLRTAIAQYDPVRVGIVLGTATGGVNDCLPAFIHRARSGAWPPYYDYRRQLLNAPAQCLAAWLGVKGPAYTLSTACTSSARALLSARRLLQSGVCDAVICGGADTLCRLTVNGFAALEALADTRCVPFSAHRCGINIGEAAVVFLMHQAERGEVALLGAGASADAWHMSAPQPEGKGAIVAMRAALAEAQLTAADIGWVNLHGTGTVLNDAMESHAMQHVFPNGVPCASTKGLTGHTLGTAGALEAALCWLTLDAASQDQPLPRHIWDQVPDPQLPKLDFCDGRQFYPRRQRRIAMSHSFAFGGNNVSLILGAAS